MKGSSECVIIFVVVVGSNAMLLTLDSTLQEINDPLPLTSATASLLLRSTSFPLASTSLKVGIPLSSLP